MNDVLSLRMVQKVNGKERVEVKQRERECVRERERERERERTRAREGGNRFAKKEALGTQRLD